MKKIVMLLLLLCSLNVSAQDVIVKKDGAAIVCRIINVSSLEVVYKKWSELKGRNYVISLNDVASITYESGEKEVFDAPAPKVETSVTTPLPQVQNTYGQQTVNDDTLLKMAGGTPNPKKARNLMIAGYVVGGGLLITGLSAMGVSLSGGIDDTVGLFAGSISMMAAGVACGTGLLVKSYKLKAESLYTVQSNPVYKSDFKLKNGTTLSPGINMMKDNTHRNTTLGLGLTYNF